MESIELYNPLVYEPSSSPPKERHKGNIPIRPDVHPRIGTFNSSGPRPKIDRDRGSILEDPEETEEESKHREEIEVPGCTYSVQPSSSQAIPHQVRPQSGRGDAASLDGNNHPVHLAGLMNAGLVEQRLSLVDGGGAAWRFLFGAFMVEALQWGFALNFGVFQNYYFEHEPFKGNKQIPIIGTLCTGIVYLGAPIITPMVKRWQRWHRYMVWFGWTLSILGLLAGSFAKDIGSLIATQGILYSLGVLIMYFPVISMLNEWFVAKRGLALGIVTAATGVSGTVMPFVLEILLNKYGYPTTLRAVAISLVILTGPVLPVLKGRLPVSHASTAAKTDWSFLKEPVFYAFAASVLLQGFGHFFPSLYLPSYVNSLGQGPARGAFILALINLTAVFGQVAFGYFSDNRIPVQVLVFASPLISALATFTLWGLARSLPILVMFSLTYGFFAGGYVVLWARMGTFLNADDPTVALTTFGVFAFLKGVGNVLAGPISSVLITQTPALGHYAIGRYKGVVIYTGICMSASSLAMVIWYIGQIMLVRALEHRHA